MRYFARWSVILDGDMIGLSYQKEQKELNAISIETTTV
jgi:hypothetical protein